jgi:tetratricopeptide (TPR) repeat protein
MNGEKAPESRDLVEFPPSSWRHGWLFGLFLVAVTLIAYGPAWHAGFIWDDDAYLTQNPLLTAPDGLRRIWFSFDSPSQYFPLTYTTFYMERALWGLNPAGYHLVNLLLHAANALLVWRVLGRLRVPGAWLAAAVFALHPVQVESVAWITERKNVLMGFFFLLTLLAWIKFIEAPCKRPGRFYVLALIFYALALSAKTTACTLPAALLLILWLEKMPINWRRLAQVAPFVAMGIGMGLVTVWWEQHHQGTQGKLFEIGLVERVLIASRALWFYAGKLLWPANLTFNYPRWTISASDPRAYGWLLATAALGLAIWRARRWTGRSVEVAAVYFAVTLSPVLGFIMLYTFQYSFVADHYQYLACIGPMALAAAGMKIGLGRVVRGKPFLQPALCAVLLMALGMLTWRQCGMYAGVETLWQATLARNPDSWLAHNNLGTILRQKGRVDEAITHYQEALQLRPDNESVHFNLARAFYQKGKLDQAIAQFQLALQLEPADMEAQNNLAWCLATAPQASLRNGDKAVQLARQANELAGGKNPVILGTLAAAFAEAGRFSEAVEIAQRALHLAGAQSNARLAGQLQLELKFYQSGSPYHIPEPTH